MFWIIVEKIVKLLMPLCWVFAMILWGIIISSWIDPDTTTKLLSCIGG